MRSLAGIPVQVGVPVQHCMTSLLSASLQSVGYDFSILYRVYFSMLSMLFYLPIVCITVSVQWYSLHDFFFYSLQYLLLWTIVYDLSSSAIKNSLLLGLLVYNITLCSMVLHDLVLVNIVHCAL